MKIWIINHYAIPPSMGGLVRHYYFSKYLQQKGHKVRIFASSKIHNTDINMITDRRLFFKKKVDGIEYTFVRNSDYKGNRFGRIINMLQFPLRLWNVCKKFEKPDVIYISSPDLFTAFTAILMAKKWNIPKVVEIRDLWPKSIVAYHRISEKNALILALYQLEKWVYKNADKLIFTMAGGKKYLKERGWEKSIGLYKIEQVNNGVDLEEFQKCRKIYQIADKDLENNQIFKVVYTGSIRRANHLDLLVECAEQLKKRDSRIKFLIWGDGEEREELEEKCRQLKLDNIVFKGRVEKKFIPYIVGEADVNYIHGQENVLMRFGISMNKQFDYLAAGKPVFSDVKPAYDLIETYGCGITVKGNSTEKILDGLCWLESQPKEMLEQYGRASSKLAESFDYKKLADKVEQILLEVCR